MADVERVSVQRAREKVRANVALLVCAYDDEQKYNKMKLEGAIPLARLEAQAATLPHDKEIIFYSGWPGEASAAGQAAKYQQRGFARARALKGGVGAWKQAGFPIAAAA